MKLNNIYITGDQSGINFTQGAPQTNTLNRLIEISQKELGKHDVLIPIHTFLTGIKSMDQWNEHGVEIQCLKSKIYPSFGVFTPTNQNYIELFNSTLEEIMKKNKTQNSLDIGCGTGILSFIMKSKGISNVTGIDINPWAIENANYNASKLNLKVNFQECNGIPKNDQKYDLIVFNPPWISDQQGSIVDSAVFDSEFTFINSILDQIDQHLTEQGRLILVFSNLSKLLGFQNEINYSKLKLLKIKELSGHFTNKNDLFYEIKKNEKIQCWVFNKN